MKVADFLNRLGDDGSIIYSIRYYNELGTEIEVKSEFKEWAFDTYGEYFISGEESIWAQAEGGRVQITLYVSREQ